jgi:UPF0176 protein
MYIIAALYHFTRFENPAALQAPLQALCTENAVRGSLLLATEGINGTIAGPRAGLKVVLAHIKALPGCADLEWKESRADQPPFGRLKVRLKKEIVTLGVPGVDPKAAVGHYVRAADWNDYEVAIGTFTSAVDPETAAFRDFPAWWETNKDRFHNKRIAMFCTGGIRCEKSTNYLMSQGIEDVYHLKGGILQYLEDVPAEDSLWQGECFVFDERVSVGHGLEEGPHSLCRACRRPLLPADQARPEYEAGVQCHHCADEHSDADRARFRERQKQIALARARGESHLAGH